MATNKPLKPTPEGLMAVCSILMRQLREITAEVTALRALLQERHLLSSDQFLDKKTFYLAQWDETVTSLLKESATLADREAVKKLLEEFEGKPQ